MGDTPDIDEALERAFTGITRTPGHYPGLWRVDKMGDRRTVHVDHHATENWIRSFGTLRELKDRVTFIIDPTSFSQ